MNEKEKLGVDFYRLKLEFPHLVFSEEISIIHHTNTIM